jgi:hypothetical protein
MGLVGDGHPCVLAWICMSIPRARPHGHRLFIPRDLIPYVLMLTALLHRWHPHFAIDIYVAMYVVVGSSPRSRSRSRGTPLLVTVGISPRTLSFVGLILACHWSLHMSPPLSILGWLTLPRTNALG